MESEETGVDEAVLADMRSMLRSVVTDGTGAAADIEGYEVCGKTSTAEIASEEGGYKKEVYNIGFCGFIDNSSSNLVCFVGANEVYAMRQTGIMQGKENNRFCQPTATPQSSPL